MIFRKVLDVDLTSKYSILKPKDNEFIERMLNKITKCSFFNDLTINPSSFKGFHVEIFCSIDCNICRICYDDDKHFAYDMNRPEYARNILFNRKEKIIIE